MNNSNQNLQVEERNKKRGLYFSIGVHVILFLIALLPLMTYPDPPPEKEGILVNFGAPDQGSGADAPQTQKRQEQNPEPPMEEVEPEPEQEVEKVEQSEASRLKPEEKILTEEESDVKVKKQAEKARQQSEAQKKAEAEAIRQKQEEAAKKLKQKKYEESKSSFSEAFKGSGKGSTNKPGSEGDTNGDPDAEKLKGISSGKGKIGGGLSDRGVAYEPPIREQTQKSGRVIIKVCVNKKGDVISADYTQKGSTTNDADLRRIAKNAAEKFRFTEGELNKQCGTITINFQLQ